MTKPIDKNVERMKQCAVLYPFWLRQLRRNLASHIYYRRGRSKYLSSFSKYLLANYDTQDQDDGCSPPWTPMRYVSEQEIAEIRARRMQFDKHATADEWIPVYSLALFGPRLHKYIYKPGHYRVSAVKQDDLYFLTACSSGVPLHHSNHWVSAHERYCRRKYEKGIEKRIAKYAAEYDRRRCLDQTLARNDVEFWQTMAMAGVAATMAKSRT